jgi:formylglycine-generating enzyme required for sulfatase activity
MEVDAFWIDAYEVTNGQYAAFVNATGHPAPAGWPYPAERVNHPVKGVTWHDAVVYCTYLGKRLPAEGEWEIAGRGPGAPPRLYPWGDDPFAGGQIDQLSQTDTHPVGSAPFTASPFGVYDLSGNVREWVGEPYAPVREGTRVIRGGRHGFQQDLAYREVAVPADPSFLPVTGFRCAADKVVGE